MTLSKQFEAELELAIQHDNERKKEDALEAYVRCLETLVKLIKEEESKKAKKQLKAKRDEIMERCEILKKKMEKDKQRDEESQKLSKQIEEVILSERPNVSWSDVIGLEEAKIALLEAVEMPLKFKSMFKGIREAWTGILLYGPAGTGKSFIAKALANKSNCTFFSVSSSDLVSKWMGESERLIKELFRKARELSPSIIFVDEIDSLCGSRAEGETESSRRIKTEFLVQMDGVGKDNAGVLLLGATNLPWSIDSAMRRRLQRRIYIPLPEQHARIQLFMSLFKECKHTLVAGQYNKLAELTENYSGSDIRNIAKKAAYMPMRMLQDATHFKPVTIPGKSHKCWEPCSPGSPGAVEKSCNQIHEDYLAEPPITFEHVTSAIKMIKPSVNQADLYDYEQWTEEFGQVS